MNIKTYLNEKANNQGYRDFQHFCDSADSEEMAEHLPNWASGFHGHKLSEITEEEIKQRSWDAVKKHDAGKRTPYQAWYARGMRDVINLLKEER